MEAALQAAEQEAGSTSPHAFVEAFVAAFEAQHPDRVLAEAFFPEELSNEALVAYLQGRFARLANQAEDNPFFRALNDAVTKNPLPPFAVIAQYLAPGGAIVTDDETGLHYTAFGLRRE